MPHVIVPPSWRIPESECTPESAWLDRRRLMLALGASGLGLAASAGCALAGTPKGPKSPIPERYALSLPSFSRSARFPGGVSPAVEITPEIAAASYNNFYEFTTNKAEVWRMASSLRPSPWSVEVSGLCAKPKTFDIDELLRAMPIEERVYRFRCVEAWSMVVPWVGFPLSALLRAVEPLADAKYLRLVTLDDKKQFPGAASQSWYPWPYHEGLTMAEAQNELAMLAVGIYGHPLPNQHGAPIRLITPWKYGYKNIKSIVKIELVTEQPPTFWSAIAGDEYDFWGNVRPDIPHPRWSQASDRVLPTGERVPTPMFNGYAEQVAGLYPA